MRPVIISSLMTGGSEGGGGQTRLSIMSSVVRISPGPGVTSSNSAKFV